MGSATFDTFPINAYNVLFSTCSNAFSNSPTTSPSLAITAVNVTADKLAAFQAGQLSSCAAYNSIFTAVTNRSSVTFTRCATNINGTGFYTNVGAGGYYLINGSTNQGVGNTAYTPAELVADLQTKTTHPPIVEPAGWFTNDYMFAPQAQWDTNASDYGYHYSPIDYAVSIEPLQCYRYSSSRNRPGRRQHQRG